MTKSQHSEWELSTNRCEHLFSYICFQTWGWSYLIGGWQYVGFLIPRRSAWVAAEGTAKPRKTKHRLPPFRIRSRSGRGLNSAPLTLLLVQ